MRLKRTSVGAGPVALADVLAQHRRFSGPEVLAANVGDGYLCATNPVYRNVRSEFLRRGYRFTQDGVVRYLAFPLMSLDMVLSAKAVPYLDNFAWLEELETRAPGRLALEDLHKLGLSFNYLFHEAAHCLAHAVIGPSRSLVATVVGEAFANTVEAVSWAFVTGDVGAYFLTANTRFALHAEGISAVIRAIGELGAAAATKTLLYAFVYSNFLYASFDAPELARIAELAGVAASDTVSGLCSVALDLHEQFRTEAAVLYLVNQGYSDAELALLERDPGELLTDELRRAVDELVRVLAAGLDAEFA